MSEATNQIARLWKMVSQWRDKEVGEQIAALPFVRVDGELKVLLITSRGTGRWVLPKGWPHEGMSLPDSAAQEALEEAGVCGIVSTNSVGTYQYVKIREKKDDIDCVVSVFPMEVFSQEIDYRERDQRNLKWFSVEDAAQRVHELDLSRLILAFGQQMETPLAA